MANENAVSLLQKERLMLLSKKEQFLSEINNEIDSIESSIEILSGKKVWETEPKTLYDDDNPNYTKPSYEE